MRRMVNGRDLFVVWLLLIAAIAFFILRGEPSDMVEIHHSGLSEIFELSADRYIVLESLPNVKFRIQDGRIAFVESDCPDQICVRTGFIGRHGQTAACLPNRVSIIVIER